MEYDFDLISIGSGSSGRSIAVKLQREGWKTAIIEKNLNHFGGTCINTGCIPTKALIEKLTKTGDFKQAHEHKNRIVSRINKGTLRNTRERVGVTVIEGFATFVDDHTVEVDGKYYSAEIIIIATGSEAAIPPIKGLKDVNYSTSYDMLNLEDPPKRLLVIGGGRIGLEIAFMLNKLGITITVFEGMPQILPGEDREITEMIAGYLEEKGLKILRGRFVDEVEEVKDKNGNVFKVHLNDGPHKGVYEGDMLLVATGRVPRTRNLNMKNTNVEMDRAAIKVNEYFQSSIPHIFAIGDVIGNPMFTNWAGYHAKLLGKNLTISKTPNNQWLKLGRRNIPRLTFIEPELASVGLTEEQTREKYGDDVVTFKFYNKWLGKSMIVDDWNGVLKGIGLKGSNEILGAYLWGVRTGSLIQTIILAMDNGLGWREVADMIYGHPVLVEGILSLASNMVNLTK